MRFPSTLRAFLRRGHWTTAGIALLASALAFGQGAPQSPPAQTPKEGPAEVTPEHSSPPVMNLQIGIGDEVEVTVFDVPELSEHERVDGQGDIQLALINSVHIAGLTSEQAEALIEKKLRDGGFVNDPHANIFVKEYGTGGITILGEVQHPGIYPAVGPRHLWDEILAAGGATDRAGTKVLIRHGDATDWQSVQLTSDPEDALKSNVEVMPGDTIFVQRGGVVYVLGEVKQSAGYVMQNNSFTVLQALAKADGPTENAALGRATILRSDASGTKSIPIDLKQMLNAKRGDIPMEDGDILFVPGRRGRFAAQSTFQSILAVATGVAVHY